MTEQNASGSEIGVVVRSSQLAKRLHKIETRPNEIAPAIAIPKETIMKSTVT